jgi:hypothetical protein
MGSESVQDCGQRIKSSVEVQRVSSLFVRQDQLVFRGVVGKLKVGSEESRGVINWGVFRCREAFLFVIICLVETTDVLFGKERSLNERKPPKAGEQRHLGTARGRSRIATTILPVNYAIVYPDRS